VPMLVAGLQWRIEVAALAVADGAMERARTALLAMEGLQNVAKERGPVARS